MLAAPYVDFDSAQRTMPVTTVAARLDRFSLAGDDTGP